MLFGAFAASLAAVAVRGLTAFSTPDQYKERIQWVEEFCFGCWRPNPDYHPSRALLALTELKLHRTLRSSEGRLFCLASGLGLNQAVKLLDATLSEEKRDERCLH